MLQTAPPLIRVYHENINLEIKVGELDNLEISKLMNLMTRNPACCLFPFAENTLRPVLETRPGLKGEGRCPSEWVPASSVRVRGKAGRELPRGAGPGRSHLAHHEPGDLSGVDP